MKRTWFKKLITFVSLQIAKKPAFEYCRRMVFSQWSEHCYLVLCPPEGCRLVYSLCIQTIGTVTAPGENRVNKGQCFQQKLKKLSTKLTWQKEAHKMLFKNFIGHWIPFLLGLTSQIPFLVLKSTLVLLPVLFSTSSTFQYSFFFYFFFFFSSYSVSLSLLLLG